MSAVRLAGGGDRQAKPATAARMYDYFLGGTHNFPADREAADAIVAMFPATLLAARVNRAFLRRTVNYLCEMGISQFLDIGSGIPTEGNVHEIAQAANPRARVVYVDIDPVAVAESQEMLEGNDLAIAIRGDARYPRQIIAHPQVRKLLDFEQPVAVLLVAVLHFVGDDDEVKSLVRQLVDAVPKGSYLVASHVIDESSPDFERIEDVKRVHDVYKRQTSTALRMRTRAELGEFFEGWELVDPGIVWVWEWKPTPGEPPPVTVDAHYHIKGGIAGGVARIT
ncbi:MAG TPA: SAM-dependent methyltransferase [Candidatus Limnocylindrales bacterium]|nr:SAM-dependent methyltransferase [Candidatus Limnocylindrales bacterium]